MKVVLKRLTTDEQTALVLIPWLPFEIIDDNSARISNNDIITYITPKASFIDYYLTLMDKFEEASLEDDEDDLFLSDDTLSYDFSDIDTDEDGIELSKEDIRKKLH